MKISIITVNYNNKSGLLSTLKSIENQTYNDYECLVIDGASIDGSQEVFEMVNDERFKFMSETDEGIFDAMNKGVHHSNGQWCIFLNSGDVFYSNLVLEKFIDSVKNLDDKVKVVYGDCLIKSTGKVNPARKDVSCLKVGDCFASHQSMFFLGKFYYDLDYKIYGDLDLLSKILKQYGHNAFCYMDIIVSIYEGGGISDTISTQKRVEKYKSIFKNFGLVCFFKSIFNRIF
ncbi:glycosyltransferase [Vibrio parahaemolyticus]|nr:glycosyltransferase [Vibrio parahaemolyticus]